MGLFLLVIMRGDIDGRTAPLKGQPVKMLKDKPITSGIADDRAVKIAAHFKSLSTDVTFEMNQGNYFTEVEWRIARGLWSFYRCLFL